MSETKWEPELIVDGIHFPPHPYRVPWSEHIAAIRSMAVREDDVFLVAYPKAGTHWMWETVHMLLSGKTEYEPRAKEHLMMEFTTVDRLDAEPSPRVLNTHLHFSMLPVRQIIDKKAKVIHVYRNPKDTVVSTWFHYKQLPPRKGVPVWSNFTLSQFVQQALGNSVAFGTWVDFMRQVQTFVSEHPEFPMFNVSFEDNKRDPLGGVRKLAQFLDAEVTDQLCQDIALACDFHNMKLASRDKTLPQGTAITLDAQMYRKGDVGDWKNHLTQSDSEAIDSVVEKGLKDCNIFNIQYTL